MEHITDPVEKEKAWEDLGRPAEAAKPIWFAYTVYVSADGSINTHPADVDDKVARRATTYDIYSTSRDLINDIESQLLADRVAKTVIANLQPADDTKEFRQRLLSALGDRGIDTPKA